MFEKFFTIKDPIGIHARPAALLVNLIKSISGEVEIEKDGKVAKANSLLSIMGLGAKTGDEIIVRIKDGSEDDLNKIIAFLEENL